MLAALADLSGTGRQLIREIAQSLKEEGLLAAGADYETIDQLLDGLEGTAGRLAQTANTPPLDVASLRREWSDLRREAAKIPTPHLPSGDALRRSWEELKATAAAQGRPVFQVSTLMALSAVSRIPENLLWLSRCAKGAARRTGQIFAGVLLDHYSATMQEIRSTGYRGVLGTRIPAVPEGRRIAVFPAAGHPDGAHVAQRAILVGDGPPVITRNVQTPCGLTGKT